MIKCSIGLLAPTDALLRSKPHYLVRNDDYSYSYFSITSGRATTHLVNIFSRNGNALLVLRKVQRNASKPGGVPLLSPVSVEFSGLIPIA